MRFNQPVSEPDDHWTEMNNRLVNIEQTLVVIAKMLGGRPTDKEWYTVREVAEILGRSEFTIREHCRLHRIHASKRACGRGNSNEWIVSAEEVRRIQNEGLLPTNRSRF